MKVRHEESVEVNDFITETYPARMEMWNRLHAARWSLYLDGFRTVADITFQMLEGGRVRFTGVVKEVGLVRNSAQRGRN